MSKPILIVDENDRPTGEAAKQEAWEKGLWHRIVRIMLEDGRGNLLLQHRSPTKDIYPNCWDNSSAGHVDAGEDYHVAAYRELEEELGLTDVPLTEIGSFVDSHDWQGKKFRRFVKVYKAIISGTPAGQEAENIDDTRWFSIEEAKKLVKNHPEKASDGLQQVIERYY